MDQPYDSTNETMLHIQTVQGFLGDVSDNIFTRSTRHDDSKLQEPEKSMYDKFTPLLRGMTYNSPEYKQCLIDMGPALQHHYECNSHHPEHYPVPATLEIGKLVLLIRHTEGIDPENPALPWLRAHFAEMQSRVNGMSLLDVVEMLADWKAAGMRHSNGSIEQSLVENKKRFGISHQLFEILVNTAKELGW